MATTVIDVPTQTRHNRWHPSIPPVVSAASGDVLRFVTIGADDGQIDRHSPSPSIDRNRIHPLTGPVSFTDCGPGDVLKIDILDVRVGSWGWHLVTDTGGFLAGEGMRASVIIVDLDSERGLATYPSGAKLQLLPMVGIVGVAPETEAILRTIEPGTFGGNLDIADLGAGCSILLPVQVEGGLLSIGDVHAAQGDGEVCLTGIETDAEVLVRVTIHHELSLDRPHLLTATHYGITGLGPDIDAALRDALRAGIRYLGTVGVPREEAYAICSGGADLRVSQLVNGQVTGARLMLPRALMRSLGANH